MDYSLSKGEAHLWIAKLDAAAAADALPALYALLAPDEQARADRFHFDARRHEFILAKAYLRKLLGRYLQQAPKDIAFAYTEHKKPYLSTPSNPPLAFNASDSHGMALYGFTYNEAIGVDIEKMRPNVHCDELVERFFSVVEAARYQQVPETEKCDAFFNAWTRKEAFIKAIGKGLSFPLDEFDVSLAPDEPAALLAIRGDAEAANAWPLQEVAAPLGYKAAVVTKGESAIKIYNASTLSMAS